MFNICIVAKWMHFHFCSMLNVNAYNQKFCDVLWLFIILYILGTVFVDPSLMDNDAYNIARSVPRSSFFEDIPPGDSKSTGIYDQIDECKWHHFKSKYSYDKKYCVKICEYTFVLKWHFLKPHFLCVMNVIYITIFELTNTHKKITQFANVHILETYYSCTSYNYELSDVTFPW